MTEDNIVPIFTDGHINRRSWELVHERLAEGMRTINWPKATGETMQEANSRIQAEVLRGGASNIPQGYDSEGNSKI